MNAGMFDLRYIDSVALGSQASNRIAESISTKRSRPLLLCQWGLAADGQLACIWRQLGPDDANDAR